MWVGLLQGFWAFITKKWGLQVTVKKVQLWVFMCVERCVFWDKEYNHKIGQAETRGELCAVRRWRRWWRRAPVLIKMGWTWYFCQNRPRAEIPQMSWPLSGYKSWRIVQVFWVWKHSWMKQLIFLGCLSLVMISISVWRFVLKSACYCSLQISYTLQRGKCAPFTYAGSLRNIWFIHSNKKIV